MKGKADLGNALDFHVCVNPTHVPPKLIAVVPDEVPTFQQVALEEIDLEIALRQRLADTAQSRLGWAQLLRDSLIGSTSACECFLNTSLYTRLRGSDLRLRGFYLGIVERS